MSEKRITREDLLEVVKVQSFALGMLIQEKQDQDDKIRGAVEESVREHIESEAGQKLKDAQARIEELERIIDNLGEHLKEANKGRRKAQCAAQDLDDKLKKSQARVEELEQRLAESIVERDNIHSHRIKLTHMFSAAKDAASRPNAKPPTGTQRRQTNE